MNESATKATSNISAGGRPTKIRLALLILAASLIAGPASAQPPASAAPAAVVLASAVPSAAPAAVTAAPAAASVVQAAPAPAPVSAAASPSRSAAFAPIVVAQASSTSVPAPASPAPVAASPAPAATPALPAGAPAMTADQAAAFQNLSPQQKGAIAQELGKSGGQITPAAVEALKGRPEFQGLSPEDVAKGRELLQKQEGEKAKEPAKEQAKDSPKEPPKPEGAKDDKAPEAAKRVITDVPKGETLFERAQNTGKYQEIPLDLRPFGYDFFRDAAVRVVTDRKDIPVPLKYVVGPGDEVRIALWGRVNASYNLVVDRDGKITIPGLGPLTVAGKTFEQMSGDLIRQAEQMTGTNADISMGALRTIPVFILGDVRRPGAYTIGANATITDALLLSGGPSEIGSMRNIQLKRKDRVVQTLDLYDLLLKGDKSKDTILLAGDVVFVPVIGPYVGVAGNVKRPALYELKDDRTLAHLFELAGGIVPTAYTQQIQVERTIKSEKQVVIDIDDKHLDRTKSIQMQDADLVKVFSIVDRNVNVVYLSGNVKRGGKYALTPGMTLKEILKDESEFLPDTHFDYALVKRLRPPAMEPVLVPFNLGDLVFRNDPASNLPLQPQDTIYVFSKWFFNDKPLYSVGGEVRKPGRFDLSGNTRVRDAILTAGGLTKDAYLKKGELVRVNRNKEYATLYFDVKRAMEGDVAENLPLQDDDRIIVHSLYEEKWRESVTVTGEVKEPGDVLLTEKMRISDLIFKAGGQTRDTLLDEAQLYRTDWKTKEVTLKKVRLGKALDGDPAENIELKDLDRLVVHSIWDKVYKANVAIEGEVKRPGNFPFGEGMTVRDLLFAAGGPTRDTLLDEAELYRTDWKTKEVTLRKVRLGKALDGDPAENVVLKDLDRVVVHSIWTTVYKANVTIEGEVKKPGTYTFGEGMTVRDLIFAASGPTRDTLLDEAELYRTDWKTKEVTLRKIRLGKALDGDPADNVRLTDLDRLVVHSIWTKVFRKSASIEGDVLKPGTYPMADNMTVRDLVFAAGNVLESAELTEAELSSQVIDPGRTATIAHRKINLGRALGGDPAHNLRLGPYDRLFVKRITDWRPERYATVAGEFRFPGRYLIRKGERLSSLIERAGGYKEGAYLRGAVFTRERVRAMQQQSLTEMADRMERDLLAGASGIAASLSAEEVAGKKAELEQRQKFIAELRQLKASGRLTVHLSHLRLLKGSPYDLELEEGDILALPQKNSAVGVVGAVMAQSSLIHSPGTSWRDYVAEAGGYTNFADQNNVFVLKVDGSARRLSRGWFDWSTSRGRWELAGFGEPVSAIEPGDTIVVPEKIERVAWLREVRDITQILMNTAVTAGVVLKLF